MIVIRKRATVGPSERPLEIVYLGERMDLPSDEELARLSAIPAPVFTMDENVVAFTAVDRRVFKMPEPYEDRHPGMMVNPRLQSKFDGASRRVLTPPTLTVCEESERVLAAMKGLRDRGRLTIDELPLLFPGDQLFRRREICGPVRDWLVAFLVRVATFTRKDKRPTVFDHVATVIRAVREIDAITPGGEFVSSGPIVDYMICEALGEGGVQLRRLLAAYGDAGLYSIAIARRRTIPRQRSKIVHAELSLVGCPYGYAKIGAHAADYALTQVWNLAGGRGDVYAFRWLCRMERYPMCSWKSLYSYRKAGLDFETPLSTGSPDDLADECLRKPAVWHWPFISSTLRDELLGPGTGDYEGRTK